MNTNYAMDESMRSIMNESVSSASYETFWEKILDITKNSFITEMQIGLERPVEEGDFISQKEVIEKNLNCLFELLNEAKLQQFYGFNDLKKDLKVRITINLLLLCGEHSSDEAVWTTDVTLKLSKCILEILCDLYSCSSVEELFVNHGECIMMLFNILRPKLLRDTWKFYPAAVLSYVWVIMKIQKPDMGKILRLVMPTILILIDDYVNTNRVVGLKCLRHIIENVTKTELSSYCDVDVLYKALEPLLYNLEPDSVNPLVHCLVLVISKKVPLEDKLKWTNYDDVMNILLPAVEMEQKLAFRTAYMESLPVLIESMGLSCVRWSNRLFRIFEEYAAVLHDREKCFIVMSSFMIAAWPRIPAHFSRLVTIILKSISDLVDDRETYTSERKRDTIAALRNCINILKDGAPDSMKQLRSDIISNENLSPSYREFLLYE